MKARYVQTHHIGKKVKLKHKGTSATKMTWTYIIDLNGLPYLITLRHYSLNGIGITPLHEADMKNRGCKKHLLQQSKGGKNCVSHSG